MKLIRLRKALAERTIRASATAASRAASSAASCDGEGGHALRGQRSRLEVEAREWRGSIVLEGRAPSWDEKIEVG
ncbi:MAG: hypothetical protein Q8M76_17865, partial [Spirochaetaceae bacterium]|nr:hypothetical protein [Spirochaetaceae bacterium]